MTKFLFQGDSITDAQRDIKCENESGYMTGSGYATVVSAILGAKYKGKYEFINRGVSGNRIVDLYARIKCDIINLKPDCLSILIGVNDVWHEVSHENGVSEAKFEKIYSILIEEIKEELPDIKIFILEPFVTHGTATDENWEVFSTETQKRADASKRIAQKHNLVFVPLQKLFDEASKEVPFTYWTKEGVHPTAMGHGIIANALMEAIEKNM